MPDKIKFSTLLNCGNKSLKMCLASRNNLITIDPTYFRGVVQNYFEQYDKDGSDSISTGTGMLDKTGKNELAAFLADGNPDPKAFGAKNSSLGPAFSVSDLFQKPARDYVTKNYRIADMVNGACEAFFGKSKTLWGTNERRMTMAEAIAAISASSALRKIFDFSK